MLKETPAEPDATSASTPPSAHLGALPKYKAAPPGQRVKEEPTSDSGLGQGVAQQLPAFQAQPVTTPEQEAAQHQQGLLLQAQMAEQAHHLHMWQQAQLNLQQAQMAWEAQMAQTVQQQHPWQQQQVLHTQHGLQWQQQQALPTQVLLQQPQQVFQPQPQVMVQQQEWHCQYAQPPQAQWQEQQASLQHQFQGQHPQEQAWPVQGEGQWQHPQQEAWQGQGEGQWQDPQQAWQSWQGQGEWQEHWQGVKQEFSAHHPSSIHEVPAYWPHGSDTWRYRYRLYVFLGLYEINICIYIFCLTDSIMYLRTNGSS